MAGGDPAVPHPDEGHDAAVRVVLGIEDEGLERSFRIPHRRGELLDDGFEELVDPRPELGGNGNGLERVQAQVGIDLFADPIDVGRGEIDLVDYGKQREVVLHRHVEIRERLGLDTLGSVDEDERPVAGHERAPDFVGEVHVARGVDEVQLVLLSVLRVVQKRNGVALDGDPALPLDIHRVQDLVAKLALGDTPAFLDESVGECRLSVIDVGDDAEVANQF